METCQASTFTSFGNGVKFCEREAGHRGYHRAIDDSGVSLGFGRAMTAWIIAGDWEEGDEIFNCSQELEA